MPIFGLGSKFSPRKAIHRKSTHSVNANDLDQLVSEDGTISLNLGDSACVFQQGNWLHNGTGETDASMKKTVFTLRSRIEELQEENYLLQIKLEILLNMLTETTAENHLQHREIEKLKSK